MSRVGTGEQADQRALTGYRLQRLADGLTIKGGNQVYSLPSPHATAIWNASGNTAWQIKLGLQFAWRMSC